MCNYLLLVGKYYIINKQRKPFCAYKNNFGDESVKKFAKLLICLCLTCSFMFTGCNLVQQNTDRYLNKTVATAGTVTITKKDLISAYNSYGYQYVQYYGYTSEKAVTTVLNNLINRELLLQEAKKHIVVDETDHKVYYLTLDSDGKEVSRRVIYNAYVWQNDILEETYDSINEQIASIEETVRTELNISAEESEEEDTDSDYSAEEVYEKKVKYENGVWSIIYDELEPDEEPMGGFVQASTGNKQVSELAYKRYIKSLIYSEKGKNLSTNESEVLQREIDRIYDIQQDNKLIEEFETQYEQSVVIDDTFNARIVDYYKKLVLASYEKYKELGTSGYEQYASDMQSDSSTVYYHPYGEKFVQVSHVLIKLTDEQLDEIEALDNKLATGVIGQQERDEEYQKILDKTIVHARDEDGNETDVTKTVSEVYAEINNELAKYNTVEEKAIAFNKFIYKYNQDTGIINASNYYVVNLDTSIDDSMVKAFADKSRELSAENKDGGNISEPVFVSSDNYSGYHIIFNAGTVKNDLSIEQVKNLTSSYAVNLYNKKIMLGTDKTYYDYIYDTIVSSDYTSYQSSIVNTKKNDIKIVIYADRIKDLYE
jgi:hypothetical protein